MGAGVGQQSPEGQADPDAAWEIGEQSCWGFYVMVPSGSCWILWSPVGDAALEGYELGGSQPSLTSDLFFASCSRRYEQVRKPSFTCHHEATCCHIFPEEMNSTPSDCEPREAFTFPFLLCSFFIPSVVCFEGVGTATRKLMQWLCITVCSILRPFLEF